MGAVKWTATPVDLIFGSSSGLRTFAEFHVSNDGNGQSVNDFVATWVPVMQLDRYDLT